MTIGEKIIAAIEKGRMCEENPANRFRPDRLGYRWMPNAAEQLEAVVEAHIEERVRVRLALDRQQRDHPPKSDEYPAD